MRRRTLDLYFNPGSLKLQPDAERELRRTQALEIETMLAILDRVAHDDAPHPAAA